MCSTHFCSPHQPLMSLNKIQQGQICSMFSKSGELRDLLFKDLKFQLKLQTDASSSCHAWSLLVQSFLFSTDWVLLEKDCFTGFLCVVFYWKKNPKTQMQQQTQHNVAHPGTNQTEYETPTEVWFQHQFTGCTYAVCSQLYVRLGK